jgi:hypothetical protein
MSLLVDSREVNANPGKPVDFQKEKGVHFDFRYVTVLKFEQCQPATYIAPGT